MILNLNEAQEVKYTDGNGDVTTRTIIATFIPPNRPIVAALDVSNMSTHEIDEVVNARIEYTNYSKAYKKNMLSFDAWRDHVGAVLGEFKYRSFTFSNLEDIS